MLQGKELEHHPYVCARGLRPLEFFLYQQTTVQREIWENQSMKKFGKCLAILHAVDIWCPYLLGKCFQIKIDNQSLKYFLEQHLSSLEKQKWVTNLFGYDYEIIYNKGKDNVVADELSRKYEDEGPLFCLSFIVSDWLQAIHQE
jgi:hypothetical protein